MSTFIFKVNKSKLGRFAGMDFGSPFNESRFSQCLTDNEGKIFRIENEITTRSTSQNKLYWMYLGIIEQETGNVATDMHELFRRTLLKPTFIKVMGQELKIPTSTSDLSKTDFSDYLDKICAATNVPIPDTAAFNKWKDSAPMIGDDQVDITNN